jgi:O-antigen/teichoic acid export membrane protein
VANAVVSTGGIIASGFGDANIQHVASRRGAGDLNAPLRAARALMGINLMLGIALAAMGWMFSPLAAAHVSGSSPALRQSCLWSLRIACVMLVVRAIESVCITTQRAFERYGAAVRVSVVARLLALATVAGLAFLSRSVVLLMGVTCVLTLAGLGLQLSRLKRLLSADSLMPAFDHGTMSALMGFGIFSWLQAVSSVVFSQVDRLTLGVSLGAAAVASYALCAQMAQPIYGFAASGLHFLFPYLSNRSASASPAALRRLLLIAFVFNLVFVAVSAGALLFLGNRILQAWAGAEIARSAAPIMPVIVWSSALLGLNVTASYALLALGRVRIVTWFNLASGAIMLLLMFYLTPRFGIQGIAFARLSYALISLLLYIPLFGHFPGRRVMQRDMCALRPVKEEL